MHDAERCIAIGRCLDDDAEADDVGKLLERDSLALHLAEDRIGPLGPAKDLGLHAMLFELFAQILLDRLDQALIAGANLGQAIGDGQMRFRIDNGEGEFFKLFAHVVHAHAASQGRIDFQCLFGNPATLFLRHEVKRAHVVKPVGQLHQQHAHIFRDGEQQLAEILGLRSLLGHQIEALDLGKPLDQPADILAEHAVDFRTRRVRILDGVMQKRDRNGCVVELQVRENSSDFKGMREVGIAIGAPLRAMLLHGIDIGFVQKPLVGLRIVPLNTLEEFILAHHGATSEGTRIGRAKPGQKAIQSYRIANGAKRQAFGPNAA